MTTFTIDVNNNITIHKTPQQAQAVPDLERFSTKEEPAELAEKWPAARLIEIWNSTPGNTPVKKFTDRETALTRIWKAIQAFGETYTLADQASAPVAEAAQVKEAKAAAGTPATKAAQEPPALEVEVDQKAGEAANDEVQPEASASHTQANVGEQAPGVAPAKAAATRKATRKQKTPTGETVAKAPREESKTSRVIEMLKREGGTTLEEIMSMMGWQKHTTRAMLSAGGSLTRKRGLVVVSEKAGEKRVYSIKA